MADDITDAIETNPGGTDLEIALAIGVSEKQVREKRRHLESKLRIEANKAKAVLEAAAKLKDPEVKASPPAADKVESTTKAAGIAEIPRPVKGERRYYFQQPSGRSIELVPHHETKSTMILIEKVLVK